MTHPMPSSAFAFFVKGACTVAVCQRQREKQARQNHPRYVLELLQEVGSAIIELAAVGAAAVVDIAAVEHSAVVVVVVVGDGDVAVAGKICTAGAAALTFGDAYSVADSSMLLARDGVVVVGVAGVSAVQPARIFEYAFAEGILAVSCDRRELESEIERHSGSVVENYHQVVQGYGIQ